MRRVRRRVDLGPSRRSRWDAGARGAVSIRRRSSSGEVDRNTPEAMAMESMSWGSSPVRIQPRCGSTGPPVQRLRPPSRSGGGISRTASDALVSVGGDINPKAPSAVCSQSSTTARWKFGSINCGMDNNNAGATPAARVDSDPIFPSYGVHSKLVIRAVSRGRLRPLTPTLDLPAGPFDVFGDERIGQRRPALVRPSRAFGGRRCGR